MQTPTIRFADGLTGSGLLRDALAATCAAHPEAFADLELPDDPGAFKRRLPDLLCAFEARRAAASERVAMARQLAAHVRDHTLLGEQPLDEALQETTTVEPTTRRGTARPGWVPALTWRGDRYEGAGVSDLAARLLDEGQLTAAAASALSWVARELLAEPLDLRGHRFALLGAGAELSPAPYLLQAGARVLWVDRAPPPDDAGAGVLVHAAGASDLLSETVAVREAVARESEQGPVHLGLFAYAPGRGRELLLTAAMNGIAAALSPASVSMLVSPTTPGEVQPEDRERREVRRAEAPRWQRALRRTGLLPDDAVVRHGDVEIARSIVPLQGPTYLAAQYLSKMMVAEAWAADRPPVRISANVAGITHTASLEHPLFLAGFRGAPTFGMTIFEPEQTRVLMTLLMLHDLLRPDAPGADPVASPTDRARAVAAQTVHGGVRSAPFVFDHTIRVAATVGLAKQPSLLLRLRS